MILTPLRARLIAILLHAVVVLTHTGPRALLWAQRSGEKEKWVTSAITQEDNRARQPQTRLKLPKSTKMGAGVCLHQTALSERLQGKGLTQNRRLRPGAVRDTPEPDAGQTATGAPHLSRSLGPSASWLSPSACGCSLRAKGEQVGTGEGTQTTAPGAARPPRARLGTAACGERGGELDQDLGVGRGRTTTQEQG